MNGKYNGTLVRLKGCRVCGAPCIPTPCLLPKLWAWSLALWSVNIEIHGAWRSLQTNLGENHFCDDPIPNWEQLWKAWPIRRSTSIHRIKKGRAGNESVNAAPWPPSQAWDSMLRLFTHPKIVFLDQQRKDLNTLKNTLQSFTLAPQICCGGSVMLLQWANFSLLVKWEIDELPDLYRSLISYRVVL